MTRKRSVRSGFEQRLLASLRECGVQQSEHLVVGFSGGPDSLALALAIRQVAPLLGLKPLLVHVDHGLRANSRLDALRCEEIAIELGVPIRLATLPAGLAARSVGVGVEERARRERYLELAVAARDWGASTIVLGHQADDQAETVLMHLVRGSGTRGLGGMRPVQSRMIPWWDRPGQPIGEFRIIRPLLAESRAAIESYLEELGATPLTDQSNLADEFDRNWMRHHVVPAILERWPDAIGAISRSATALRLDNDFLDRAIQESHHRRRIGDRTLSTDILLDMDRAVAFHAIRDWLLTLGFDQPGFDVVARIYRFIETNNASATIEIGSGMTAVLDGDRLMTSDDFLADAITRFPLQADALEETWSVSISGEYAGTIDAVEIASRDAPKVRVVRPGDRWAGTRRRVTEDLRANGIHPLLRRHVLAVVDSGGVLLIPAIYPTIHASVVGEGVRKGWVRWQKV